MAIGWLKEPVNGLLDEWESTISTSETSTYNHFFCFPISLITIYEHMSVSLVLIVLGLKDMFTIYGNQSHESYLIPTAALAVKEQMLA